MREYGIYNDVDRPCSRLLGERRGDKFVYLLHGATLPLSHGRFTPIEDFGVHVDRRVISGKQVYRCTQVQASIAVYKDGRPRPWQDNDRCAWHEVSPLASEAL